MYKYIIFRMCKIKCYQKLEKIFLFTKFKLNLKCAKLLIQCYTFNASFTNVTTFLLFYLYRRLYQTLITKTLKTDLTL